jgi:UDP-N-acetylmuramoyl-L-alanyl-D-glutamate--2,6-diaminopimelate ligase
MRLAEILQGIEFTELLGGDENLEIASVTNDSRHVVPGTMFVALGGTKVDGHHFVDDAMKHGAACIVHEKTIEIPHGTCHVRVDDTRKVYPLLAARIAGMPSEELRVIGVTGTNGKTSTTLLTDAILRAAGYSPAVLGTLGARLPLDRLGTMLPLGGGRSDTLAFTGRGLTTPDAADLQATIRQCIELGATHLIMEASSHAIDQRRMDYVHFRGRVFTNLTQDHLDYHRTMEEYAAVKRGLFTRAEFGTPEYAVLNADTEFGASLLPELPYPVLTYGLRMGAALTAHIISQTLAGTKAELFLSRDVKVSQTLQAFQCIVETPLIGRFNIYNILASAGAALMEGTGAETIAAGVAALKVIPGRLQRVENSRGIHVFVDYAHTPDALANVLTALREVAGGSRIICVFGCGGDRDRSKRPLMGQAVARLADAMVITNDNPRSEAPLSIIADILAGLPPAGTQERLVEPDRGLAIQAALAQAMEGDAVLIAGKGHEDYQIFADRTEHFSDVETARALLA